MLTSLPSQTCSTVSFCLFFLQVKYKEDVQKQQQSSLFSSLRQTPQTELAKEAAALQSEVMCVFLTKHFLASHFKHCSLLQSSELQSKDYSAINVYDAVTPVDYSSVVTFEFSSVNTLSRLQQTEEAELEITFCSDNNADFFQSRREKQRREVCLA